MSAIPHNEQPLCSNCRYFSPPVKDAETPSAEGHCRRYPPGFRIDGAKVGHIAEFKAESAFPRTPPENWCGEHRRSQ